MPAQIAVKKISYPAHSSWIWAYMETCDNQLAVWYKWGMKFRAIGSLIPPTQRHEKVEIIGGVPGVCCLYPQATDLFYWLMKGWPSKGKFVHHSLYRLLPYKIVQPPNAAAIGCACSVGVASSKNPSNAGDSVTFTATITDTSGSATVVGTVSFYDGASLLGTGSALASSGNPVTSTFTTAALGGGNHTIKATFTPTAGSGFLTCSGTMSQDVNRATSCSVASSKNPSNSGDSVTFTVTITNNTDSVAPTGSVEWFDGATDLGAGTALSPSGNTATSTFTTSSLSVGTHVIKAVYTPTGDFQGCNCTISQVVNSANVCTTGCAGGIPQTLHLTLANISNCAGLAGTYSMTWVTNKWTVDSNGVGLSGNLSCPASAGCTGFKLSLTCGGVNFYTNAVPTSCTCSPVSFTYANAAAGPTGCCPGTPGTVQASIVP
jgi:hypothetical protein